MLKDSHDVLVIGGGPAGATAAILLAQAGWTVVLVERKRFPRKKVCGEYLSATNLPLLDRLGVGKRFRAEAGPPVQQVGLFAGRTLLRAGLPRLSSSRGEWGRALSRERLDSMLLERARAVGVDVRQPATVVFLRIEGDRYASGIEIGVGGISDTLSTRLVVGAHGSWDSGTLLTQPPRQPPAPSDLLGFKAHFQRSRLHEGLMPLLAFPGGYGGMVHCDQGRISLSCCIRRDRLALIRQTDRGDAGNAVLAFIKESCLGARLALETAHLDGPWLAAGPIRPGIRVKEQGGIFLVGNAAGEAHPIIAEGISIAMQSAWLLSTSLNAWRRCGGADTELRAVGRDYASLWRRHFGARVALSELLAQWAMRPVAVAGMLPWLRVAPSALNWFARLSGKAKDVVRQQLVDKGP